MKPLKVFGMFQPNLLKKLEDAFLVTRTETWSLLRIFTVFLEFFGHESKIHDILSYHLQRMCKSMIL